MKLITALYKHNESNYDVMVLNLKLSAEKLGYELIIYPLEDNPMTRFDAKDNYFAPCYFKPYIIKRALLELEEDVLWVDGDCLMNARVDEMLDGVDAAVTLRRFNDAKLRDIYDGYINAGVMAFRFSPNAFRLLDMWITQLSNSRADQDAMNRVLLDYSPLMNFKEIIEVKDIKVKVLDCDTYNFFYFEDAQDIINRAKIYHIKGHLRPIYYDKIVDKVLSGG